MEQDGCQEWVVGFYLLGILALFVLWIFGEPADGTFGFHHFLLDFCSMVSQYREMMFDPNAREAA